MKRFFDYIDKFQVHLLMVGFAIASLTLMVFYTNSLETIRQNNIEIKHYKSIVNSNCDSIVRVKDSINDELYWDYFNISTDNQRHELTRDEILSKYPKIKKEYEDFYNNQTE